MKKRYLGKLSLLVLAAAAAFLIASPGITGNNEEEKTATAPATEKQSDGEKAVDLSGVKAATDEEGNLRPLTAAESKELEKQLRKTLDKYKKHSPKTAPNGAISLVTAPESIELTVVTTSPEGGSSVHCMTAEDLAAAAKTDKAEEEKQ